MAPNHPTSARNSTSKSKSSQHPITPRKNNIIDFINFYGILTSVTQTTEGPMDKIDELITAINRIATALEQSQPKVCQSIGGIFGSLTEFASKRKTIGGDHPDDYSYVLLQGLTHEYPEANYPNEITRHLTPELMVGFTEEKLASSPSYSHYSTPDIDMMAQVLVLCLQDAGFWKD
jgi:hypothetical protein